MDTSRSRIGPAVGVGLLVAVGWLLLPAPVRPVTWFVFPSAGALLMVVGARRHGVDALPPRLAAAGTALFGAVTTVLGLDPGGGLVAVTALLWLLGTGLFVTSSLLLARLRAPRGDTAGVIDSLVLLVALAALLWEGMAAAGGGRWGTVAAVAPLLGAVVLAATLRVLFAGAVRNRSAQALVAASTVSAVASVLDGVSTATFPVVPWLLWTLTVGLTTLAHWLPDLPELYEPMDDDAAGVASRGRLAVLGLALLAVPLSMLPGWRVADDGAPVAVLATIACILLALWRTAILLGEHERARATLARQATHDELTGLPNRRAVLDALARRAAAGAATCVLFVDLDGFKAVNDTLGHASGDEVLCEVGRRLCGETRGTDLVGRLAGDEFVVVTDDRDDASVRAVATRVVATLASPVALDGGRHATGVGASVGIARRAPGEAPEQLLARADVAMYRSKEQGPGTVTAVLGPAVS